MIQYLAIFLATTIFLIYLLKLYFERKSDFWKKLGFPTVKTKLSNWDILTGRRFPFENDQIYYEELGDEKFGGMVEMGVPVLLIKDLDLARNIFVKDFDTFFDRRDFGTSDKVFSESLFFLQGSKWKGMRSFLSPTFTSGKIKRMFQHMDKAGKLMTTYVKKNSSKEKDGFLITVPDLMKRFAVEVIGTAVFGMETNVFTDPDSIFFKMAMKITNFSFKRKVKFAFITGFPTLSEILQLKIIDDDVHNFLVGTLSQALKVREASSESRDDFVQLLVEAKKGDNKLNESELNNFEKEGLINNYAGSPKIKLTEIMAVGQGFLFFIAGLDTISMFLSFAMYLLALHPKVQEKVYKEVERVINSSNDKELKYEDVNTMEYLDMFSSEVLRFFPPVVRLERKCMKDYPIPGSDKVIPKGTIVGITSDSIHRDGKYYPEPEKFDPERFNSENKALRNQYAYMPFGIGPRNCIGMRFAQIESKTALSYLVYNFRIDLANSTPIPLKYYKEVGGHRVPNDLQLRVVPRIENNE